MTRYGASVAVRTRDGRRIEKAILEPRGSGQNPLLWDDVAEKFCRLTQPFVSAAHQQTIVETVGGIESGEAAALVETLRYAMKIEATSSTG